ncbi:MAG TPA: hypothetical protein VNM16_00010 [Bacillota bacterium]|nr:hypothetical protein [Bacillota bacterium]
MKEILLPAELPLSLVTTVVRADPLHDDRLLLDLHTPTQDIRLRFADEFVLLACRRALSTMVNDLRRLDPDAIATHVRSLHADAYQLSFFPRRL